MAEGQVKLRHGATAYDLGESLGQGGFGVCYKATERVYPARLCNDANGGGGGGGGGGEGQPAGAISERTVAVKKVCMQQVRQASKEPHLWYEISLHSQLSHRNIVELYNNFIFEDNVYYVLEYCSNRSLADIVHRVTSLSLELGAYYFKQLIDGVQYLHDSSILHRDLKMSNILINSDDTVKITDFGLACTLTRAYLERHIACGTPNYLSPEVLLRQGHTTKSDIWSCGVILYAMFGGVPPFQTETITAIYTNIVNCSYTFSKHHTDEHLKDLIVRVLLLDPSERPDLDIIAHHPFCHYGTAYKALLSKENNRSTSCTGLRRSKSMRNLSKSLSNLFSKQSRSDLRKSTEKLFHRHVAIPLSKSLTVVDLRVVRRSQLIDYFRGEHSWEKRATEFSGGWITWWLDRSEVCGLYYQLSNNFNCAMYNDQTGCLQSTRTGRYYFIDLKAQQRQLFHEAQPGLVERFFQPLVKDLDEAFKDVRANHQLQEQLSWVSQGRSSGAPNYLINWRSYANGYYHVFHMRDLSVQVNFADWFILRICGQLCYFYQPTKKGFVVETAEFQTWCLQEVNAELVEVLCSLFL